MVQKDDRHKQGHLDSPNLNDIDQPDLPLMTLIFLAATRVIRYGKKLPNSPLKQTKTIEKSHPEVLGHNIVTFSTCSQDCGQKQTNF